MRVTEKAFAKINLALETVSVRSDGYHDLKMIMVPIDIHDTLVLETSDKNEVISNVDIKDNLIVKAISLFQETYQINEKVKVTLDKKIPIGAGLGGGSSDVAATIRGLNKLFNLNKPLNELEELVLEIGSDTLFCLYSRPAYVYGRGEFLEFINKPEIKDIYLLIPNISVSTKEVFKNHVIKKQDTKFIELLELYKNGNISEFFDKTYNDLLNTSLKAYPKLDTIYNYLTEKYDNIFMSGSGSTFFKVGKISKKMIESEKMVRITKIKLK